MLKGFTAEMFLVKLSIFYQRTFFFPLNLLRNIFNTFLISQTKKIKLMFVTCLLRSYAAT